MSLPREITLGEDGSPRLYPVEEFESVLKETGPAEEILADGAKRTVEIPDSGAYCLRISIPCAGIRARALEIGTKAYGKKATVLRVDFEKESLSLDRRNGDETDLPKGKTVRRFAAESDRIELTVLVDRCSVEAFLDRGKVCMSTTVYPKEEKQGLWVRAEAGTVRLEDVLVSEVVL